MSGVPCKRDIPKPSECLVFKLAVVHHFRDFETAVYLDHFAEFRSETYLPATGIEEGSTVDHPREDKLCAETVRWIRRTISHQSKTLTIFAFKIGGGFQRFLTPVSQFLYDRAHAFPISSVH